MRCFGSAIAVALCLASLEGAQAQAQALRAAGRSGDTYALTLSRDTVQSDNRGGSARSSSRDTLIARVVEARADGVVLEYDFPDELPVQQRASEWRFPVRVFRPEIGPMRLLNHAELEARVDGWLKRAGLTRANCGQLIFTWNAFRIDCDAHSVTGIIQRFELAPFEVREGAAFVAPLAQGPARLVKRASETTLVAEVAVDPDAVRRANAESDVGVGYIVRKPLTLKDALADRARDAVSGTIAVTFETAPGGGAWRRTIVTRLDVRRPDGRVETKITTETLERRAMPPGKSLGVATLFPAPLPWAGMVGGGRATSMPRRWIVVATLVCAGLLALVAYVRLSPLVAQDACLDGGGAWRDGRCVY